MGLMRKLFVLPLALVILYINYGSAYAQDMGMNTTSGELKVTTVSDAALQKYIDARGAMENMQMDKAYGLFADAIRLDPDFALAYVFSGITAGDFPTRVKNIDKAVALKDKVTPGETYLIGYYKAALEGNYPVQKECITKLSEMYPKDKRVLTYTGMYWYGDSKYDKAITYLDKAVTIDPNYAPAYNMLGYSYMGSKDFSNAETAFEKYISLMPNSPNPHDSYAELLLTEGKYDQSIDQYKKALAIDPTFTNSLKGIGDNYCLKGDYAVAREYYQKLYDTAPDVYSKESALYGISVSYVREGKTDMALSTLDKRVDLAE
jgi:tetratricopeptide (TPR) repeat protein